MRPVCRWHRGPKNGIMKHNAPSGREGLVGKEEPPMADKNKAKGFFAEFRQFIARGNVLDLAVGVIIGGAFSAITSGPNSTAPLW